MIGIDFKNDCIFFTKNGRFLNIAFRDVFSKIQDKEFYVVVGSSSPGCIVEINFKAPFLFDNKDYQFSNEKN